MVKITEIKQVASVYSGYPFRTSISHSQDGNYELIQIKDLVLGTSIIDLENLTTIKLEGAKKPTTLNKGDILLASKTSASGGFRSVVFNSEENNVIASSSILIIRPDINQVSSDYLCAYLNSFQGQQDLAKNLSGSSIKVILKNDLENIQIPLPAMQKQQFFKSLYENLEQQNKLNKRKALIYQNIQNAALYTITNVK